MTNDPDNYRTWEAWHKIHQTFELDWWKKALAEGHSRDDKMFAIFWREVSDFIQPRGNVLDIGCGPRPPFPPCTVIEPLAHEYRELVAETDWWREVSYYAMPAEHLVDDLRGRFDTIICWNCIDHAVGWRDILDNMLVYGKEGARYAIATDFFPPFIGHPGFERDDFMAEITLRFRIIDQREPFGRALALLMEAKP